MHGREYREVVDNVHLWNTGSKALILGSMATNTLQYEDSFVDFASIVHSAARQAMMKKSHSIYTTAIFRFTAVVKRREKPVAIII